MKKLYILTYLILQLILNLSCVEQKSTEKEVISSEIVNTLQTDTLKFTSGIRSIFQDSKGNYWLGSHQEGVCPFDGKSFQYFTTNQGLADNQIRSIQEDKEGRIWIGTANGVISYDGKRITNHTPLINIELQNDRIQTGNDLWFSAGNKAGVYRYDGQKVHYIALPVPKNTSVNDSYGVTDISKGHDGKIWIATYAALFTFDGKSIKLFDKSKFDLKEQEVLHIRSVLADSKGRIWIGNNGIGVLLMEHDKTIHFSEINGLIHKNSNKNGDHSPPGTLEHVFAMEEDSEGNIWFGDRDTGAWKYDGKTMKNYTIDSKLSTPMIWTIYKDNNDHLLFGMANGGVYQFNGKSFDKRF